MRILGIETSCDETAAAVVEDGRKVQSNVISSSKRSFENLAGVIPEEAARKQIECIMPVIEESLLLAKAEPESLDAIAVTRGPGLLGSLLVGTTAARALAALWKKPIVGVPHTLGHLSSVWLEQEEEISFPVLCLSASGGHTELWLRESHTKGVLLGRTRDDAAGEAFDKGASILGLPYPGGPSIEKCAVTGDPQAFEFPLPLRRDPTLDFSFSGLKTALKYTLRDLPRFDSRTRADFAASFQHAIVQHLMDRVEHAIRRYPSVHEMHVVGGVSANTHLRSELSTLKIPFRVPKKQSYCTDNGAMIAAAGYFLFQEKGADACGLFTTEASLALKAII